MKKNIFILFFLILPIITLAQSFSHQDSIRGSITVERSWWDLTYYHLQIKVDINKKLFQGKNTIHYTALSFGNKMQIDLQPPLKITKVIQDKKELNYTKDGNAYYINFKKMQKAGDKKNIEIYYEGHPKISVNPPWSGGVTWSKDKNGNDFIATSCQGDGASLWWPCKDHMYDEVDSMLISITVPEHLINVSNGRLRSVVKNKDKTRTFNWFVNNPINNYGVNMNIGDYVHFSEIYTGEKGPLDCDYYVLKDNLAKAKKHFKDVTRTLQAFEYWFGPYPFYEDGYKLVEVPYLGMEHQSSITYGNHYANGYLGKDLSQTGWGLKWDFIIVHESGHEWFGNNITNKDIADMWIHESFTAYAESLFLNYHYNKKAGADYIIGTRQKILNNTPIIGPYKVNKAGSVDMYYKGANMLHTLRQLIKNDALWRKTLRGLNKDFYHKTVSTQQIENYISEKTGINLSAFFNQYLRDTRIPVLTYVINDKILSFKWDQIVASFDMPVLVFINEKKQWIYPKANFTKIETENPIKSFKISTDFYVAKFNLNGRKKD